MVAGHFSQEDLMLIGQKHLIKCRCVLQQFKMMSEPPVHHFVVFSIIDNDDLTNVVQPKFAQCNNCGIIHKVIDICRSEILQGRESMGSIRTIEEIKLGIPKGLSTLLESNNADLASWEAAEFIYEQKQWGNIVVLSTDASDGMRQGKYVRILGESLFKVETYVTDDSLRK